MRTREKTRLLNVAKALRDAVELDELFTDAFTFAQWGFNINPLRDPDLREALFYDENFVNELTEWGDSETINEDEARDILAAVTALVQKGLIPHNCGAPACALGHYATRRDLQNKYKLTPGGALAEVNRRTLSPDATCIGSQPMANYFGITCEQTEILFGVQGCGGTTDPIVAAEYIETFVANQG